MCENLKYVTMGNQQERLDFYGLITYTNSKKEKKCMEKEIFKPMKGYEEYYEISNKGRIRRIKYDNIQNEKQYGIPYYIKYRIDKDGYLKCDLSLNGKIKRYMVHRLVIQNFGDNPENKPCVNHKDGNKQNNDINNLEYVTVKENNLHALQTGLRIMKNNNLSKQVEQCDLDGNVINIYKSANDAKRITGYSQGHISECCRGELKTYKNFIWRYKSK